jgi:uncharacterized delta-60 repeat protein
MNRVKALLFFACVVICLSGCSGPETGSGSGQHVTGVTLQGAAAVVKGETLQLTATVVPSEADDMSLTWATSDAAVATVSSSGLVTGVTAGRATVSATTTDGGFSASCAVTVYTHGGLDASFGSGGLATLGGGSPVACAMAVQSDGKIVVAGCVDGAVDMDLFLARYDADGTLDASFGSGGTVTSDFGGSEVATGLAIQSDGKIVAAGYSNSDLFVARYGADGSPDPGFAEGGLQLVTLPSGMEAGDGRWPVALRGDGIIVAGGAYSAATGFDFLVMRLTAAGHIDLGFADSGFFVQDFDSGEDAPTAIALQAEGFIVSGHANVGGMDDFAAIRLTDAGALDTDFGDGGLLAFAMGNTCAANASALQGESRLVLAGYRLSGGSALFFMEGFDPYDGALDPSFGSGGTVSTDMGSDALARAVLLQSDGKIIVAGDVYPSSFGLARYSADGVLDAGFGDAGIRITSIGGDSSMECAAMQADGKILVAGYANLSGSSLIIARFWP